MSEEEEPIDRAQAREVINQGAKAMAWLTQHATDDWMHWSIVVRGWQGLRALAFADAGTRDTTRQAYRDAMTALLERSQQGRIYAGIAKETRNAMTKLCDHIDEVDQWYAALSSSEKLHWKNPQTIAKHCPPHLLAGQGRNFPLRKSTAVKKKKGNPEAEALRATLIRVITKFVMPADPEEAKRLLDTLYQGDPDDGLDGLGKMTLPTWQSRSRRQQPRQKSTCSK